MEVGAPFDFAIHARELAFHEFYETTSSGPISCDACTYANAAAALCCEMCFRPNSRVMQLACTWEWRASEQDPWMAFDAASIAQIEAAFGAGHPSVALSHGFFAAHRGAAAYEVHFDRSARRQHFQINTHTGNRRRVRRIGNGMERLALSFILFWPVCNVFFVCCFVIQISQIIIF